MLVYFHLIDLPRNRISVYSSRKHSLISAQALDLNLIEMCIFSRTFDVKSVTTAVSVIYKNNK